MIFLFPRWDMLIPWRVCIFHVSQCDLPGIILFTSIPNDCWWSLRASAWSFSAYKTHPSEVFQRVYPWKPWLYQRILSFWGSRYFLRNFRGEPLNFGSVKEISREFICFFLVSGGGFIQSFGHFFRRRNYPMAWENIFLNWLETVTIWLYGCFLKWWYPPKHSKMIIFSRKTQGCWGNPPFQESPR